jgi:hypothetical protein
MIEMQTGIRNVADPVIIAGVDVRSVGMTGLVGMAGGQRGVGRGAMSGDMSAADRSTGGSPRLRMRLRGMAAGGALRRRGTRKKDQRQSRENCQRADEFLHGNLRGTGYSVQVAGYSVQVKE